MNIDSGTFITADKRSAMRGSIDMFGYPEFHITIHKARNGLVVRVANHPSQTPEIWIVQEGQSIPEIVAAALAANAMGSKSSEPHGY